jgi:inhibitor of KinA
MIKRIVPGGDSMLLVEFEDEISPFLNATVLALDRQIGLHSLSGVIECVPSYRSLAVFYNPVQLSRFELEKWIMDQARSLEESPEPAPRRIEVPVVYGGEMGPDLETIANAHHLPLSEVVSLHIEPLYRVYFIGFSPGFPYLGGLSPRLITPRMKTPRRLVPAGSVAIGGEQTGIYSSDTPGGWQIIGRTPLKLFSLNDSPPCLFRPGDLVTFRPITLREFYEVY